MKVSIDWLKELVDLNVAVEELAKLLNLKTIATKEITKDFIELDMKGYNRADLLSVRGVAYEAAALLNSQVKFQEPNETEYIWVGQNLPKLEILVQNSHLSPIYCLAKIEGLETKESNSDWVKKLTSSGLRPVNNVADVTNLVMLEYGQPLHAFDARAVKNENIIVRNAKEGERITTLDGKTRDLETDDLLITDPQNALGIAGVMGGKDSEISNSTSTILLEAAIFDPVTLRKTANRLGLQSEASKRFYHGLTVKRLFQALDAAIRMYQSSGGKLMALTIQGTQTDPEIKIDLRQEKVNSLIGIDIKAADIKAYLERLKFELKTVKEDEWAVIRPYFRLDVGIEEDLIEEVARMYGYEKIPAKPLTGALPDKVDQGLFELIYKIKTNLSKLGLTEVQTYSFYSTAVLNALDYDPEIKKSLIKVANPISAETEYLRRDLWPNLMEVAARNVRNGFKDVAIFEAGKLYFAGDGKPEEEYWLSLGLVNNTNEPILELKGIFEVFNQKLALGILIESANPQLQGRELFHPERFYYFKLNGQVVGGISEVHPKIAFKMGLENRLAILQLDLKALL